MCRIAIFALAPIVFACACCNVLLLRRLFWNTRARARAQFGQTALILAAGEGHVNCVRLLLDAGADKEAKNVVRAMLLSGTCSVHCFVVCIVQIIFQR